MKKFIEVIIMFGFAAFVLGGFVLVVVQIFGLFSFNPDLVKNVRGLFSWIFPTAALTGALCWLYTYFQKE